MNLTQIKHFTENSSVQLARLDLQRWTRQLRLLAFMIVGASGLVVNSAALFAFTEFAGLHYLLSAALATQASTLWNFGLTEAWVFADRANGGTVLRRLGRFMLMNNSLLILRGPFLSLLVSGFGIHYVAANLATLVAVTLLRYVVADRWVWRGKSAPSKKAEGGPAFAFCYDIHGLIQIASMFRLPELEYFRVPGPFERPDIRVRRENRRRARDGGIRYGEALGRYGFEMTILQREPMEIAVSPLLGFSPHVLYTNVIEPMLRWTFVRKGYALVHAACLSFGGQGVLVTARTDTGKTTTILRSLTHHACAFLSDDMTIVGRDGQVRCFPKPLTISHHTLRAVNTAALSLAERLALQVQSLLHSRSGRQFGMRLSEMNFPAASLNAVVQMIIPPPKYMVNRLVANAKFADRAHLTNMFLIERGALGQASLSHREAVEVLLRNSEDAYGFPPYPQLARSLSQWRGQDLRGLEVGVVSAALGGSAATRLSDPEYGWWRRLSAQASAPPAAAAAGLQPAPAGA